MSLREYQHEAVAALEKGWGEWLFNIGVSLPTGTGKTHIMAQVAKNEADSDRPGRVLWLVHQDVLVEQSMAKLRATLTPGTSLGLVKGSRNELGARVIVASVHSLRSESRRAQLPPISLCIVDEAHMSVSPTYLGIFRQLGAIDGGPEGARTGGRVRMAGFSATWTRSDATGLGDVWEDIVYGKTIKWAVEQGHLVKPRAIQVGESPDWSDVRTNGRNGEYRDSDAGKAVMLEELRESLVRGMTKFSDGRPAALFAPTVESAEYFGDALREAGYPTAGLYGSTPTAERRLRHAKHRTGEIRVLTTCTALAVGWDEPSVALGLLLRPVRHEGLFVQIFGRFLRPWPGKTEGLLLDFVGATDDVKLRNAIDLGKSTFREGELDLPIDDDELEDTEPVTRERIVKQRKSSYEVEIFAGTSVQWLMGPSGIPFVPCGEEIVFVLEDVEGWHVCRADARLRGGQPRGEFVHSGLTQADALELASDVAEDLGLYIARRNAAWRDADPSDAQKSYAANVGITGWDSMTRGVLSDTLSVFKAFGVLSYFDNWSRARLAQVAS